MARGRNRESIMCRLFNNLSYIFVWLHNIAPLFEYHRRFDYLTCYRPHSIDFVCLIHLFLISFSDEYYSLKYGFDFNKVFFDSSDNFFRWNSIYFLCNQIECREVIMPYLGFIYAHIFDSFNRAFGDGHLTVPGEKKNHFSLNRNASNPNE